MLLGAGKVVAHRLLQIDVPAVAEELDDAFDVQWNGQQRLDGVDLETAGGELGDGCERPGGRPVGLSLSTPLFARVDEGHDLDIGIVEVGADVEVVDASEPDEGGSHGSVVGSKGRGHRRNTIRGVVRTPDH